MAASPERQVLVIRTARPDVLAQYLVLHPGNALSVLTTPVADLTAGRQPASFFRRVFTAPAGPLRWENMPPALQEELRATAWDEIVVLHNRGTGYGPIFELAGRIASRMPVRVFYADGAEATYASAAAGRRHEIGSWLIDKTVAALTVIFVLPVFFALLAWYRLKAWWRQTRFVSPQ